MTEDDLARKILAEAMRRGGGKVLKELLNGQLLDAPDPLLRGSGKVLDKLRRTTDRLKDKLGL